MKQLTKSEIEIVIDSFIGFKTITDEFKEAIFNVLSFDSLSCTSEVMDALEAEYPAKQTENKHIPFGRQYLQTKKKQHWK